MAIQLVLCELSILFSIKHSRDANPKPPGQRSSIRDRSTPAGNDVAVIRTSTKACSTSSVTGSKDRLLGSSSTLDECAAEHRKQLRTSRRAASVDRLTSRRSSLATPDELLSTSGRDRQSVAVINSSKPSDADDGQLTSTSQQRRRYVDCRETSPIGSSTLAAQLNLALKSRDAAQRSTTIDGDGRYPPIGRSCSGNGGIVDTAAGTGNEKKFYEKLLRTTTGFELMPISSETVALDLKLAVKLLIG